MYRLPSTYLGESRYNDTLPNYLSEEFAAKEVAHYTHYKTELTTFPEEILSEDQRLSKALMAWEIDIALAEKEYLEDLMPIDQMWSFHLSFGQLASGQGAQPFNTVEDYNNWLVRCEGYLAWMHSAEDKMRQGMEKGWVLPTALIEKVLPQLEQMITKTPETHLFYAPIEQLPAEFSEEEKDRLTAAYTAPIQDKIIPAYQQLHDFMAKDYKAAGRSSSGYNALEGGDAYYQHAIKRYTTTNMTPDEIHQLGLDEVARIRTAMEEVKTTVGFEGDLMAFFDHVRTHAPLMPFDEPQQVIDNFNAIHQVIPKVNELFRFNLKPLSKCEEPKLLEKLPPVQNTIQAPWTGVARDVPIRDVKTYNTHQDEDLFLHEAIRGTTSKSPSTREHRTSFFPKEFMVLGLWGRLGFIHRIAREGTRTLWRPLSVLRYACRRNAPRYSFGGRYRFAR